MAKRRTLQNKDTYTQSTAAVRVTFLSVLVSTLIITADILQFGPRLLRWTTPQKTGYAKASPLHHIIIDDLFPKRILQVAMRCRHCPC